MLGFLAGGVASTVPCFLPSGGGAGFVERAVPAGVAELFTSTCWVLRQHVVLFLGVVFENCRVDASIFVVKLCRAHGGCLGIRGR
jgi:hypothetical protein